MKKLCIVVSSSFTLEVFLVPQIRALSRLYEVSVIVNTRDKSLLQRLGIDAKLIPVLIERKIHVLRDAHSLLLLFRVFRANGFDLVHSVTPKAGLLSMAGAFLARTPIRIHTFTGQVWGTKRGIGRWILKAADKVTALLATDILVDSPSQREFIIQEKVISRSKSQILANGSISGVDVNRFRPNPDLRLKIRMLLGIPLHSFVILYMSRLTRDKGAIVMAEAFAVYGTANRQAQLIIVGPDEEALRPQIRQLCCRCIVQVHFLEYVNVPEEYMACADVFCMPSYREGFGTALINAAAVGIPAIASRIYGSSDAVSDGVTGLLFEAGNIKKLIELLGRLEADEELRRSIGQSARERAVRCFSEDLVTSSLLSFYGKRLKGYAVD